MVAMNWLKDASPDQPRLASTHLSGGHDPRGPDHVLHDPREVVLNPLSGSAVGEMPRLRMVVAQVVHLQQILVVVPERDGVDADSQDDDAAVPLHHLLERISSPAGRGALPLSPQGLLPPRSVGDPGVGWDDSLGVGRGAAARRWGSPPPGWPIGWDRRAGDRRRGSPGRAICSVQAPPVKAGVSNVPSGPMASRKASTTVAAPPSTQPRLLRELWSMTQSPFRTPSRLRSRVRRFLVMVGGEEAVLREVSATGCENVTAPETDQDISDLEIPLFCSPKQAVKQELVQLRAR